MRDGRAPGPPARSGHRGRCHMAEGRLPLRATAMPSRWWLVLSIPAVAVLSVVVVAVVRALEPGHSPPTFTRTERFGPVADTYVDARVRDRSFGRAESLRLPPPARGGPRLSPPAGGRVGRAPR